MVCWPGGRRGGPRRAVALWLVADRVGLTAELSRAADVLFAAGAAAVAGFQVGHAAAGQPVGDLLGATG